MRIFLRLYLRISGARPLCRRLHRHGLDCRIGCSRTAPSLCERPLVQIDHRGRLGTSIFSSRRYVPRSNFTGQRPLRLSERTISRSFQRGSFGGDSAVRGQSAGSWRTRHDFKWNLFRRVYRSQRVSVAPRASSNSPRGRGLNRAPEAPYAVKPSGIKYQYIDFSE
jgi:hypothetical protein